MPKQSSEYKKLIDKYIHIYKTNYKQEAYMPKQSPE